MSELLSPAEVQWAGEVAAQLKKGLNQVMLDGDSRLGIDNVLKAFRAGFGEDCRNFRWQVLRVLIFCNC